jgi:Zn-finger nucleic acid-binding protein
VIACPRCATSLEDSRCATCGGLWLSHEQVRDQIGELESTGGVFSKRSCPVCLEQMQEPLIFGVPLDHCLKHGFWFDARELEETIAASKSDAWRLYGSGGSGEAGARAKAWNPLDGLLEVLRVWRRK